MQVTDLRVWTRAELQDRDTADLPRIRRAGDRVRVATRFTPRPDDPDNARYELISPCCGKRTYVQHGYVRRMITGQWPDQTFECGKPWAYGRGNPRNGGCRACYEVKPALIEDGRPTAFDLIWTGHGEISTHPGGPGSGRN
jgi:hypothetical protein